MNAKVISLLVCLSAGQALGAANTFPAPMAPDFDGNGVSDIMFYGDHDDSGQATLQVDCRGADNYNNPILEHRHVVSQLARTSWEVTLGDFDGDGQDDIFLYDRTTHSTGTAHLIRMTSDCHTRSSVTLATDWGTDWEIYPGDFDGDGADDLFLFDKSGGSGLGNLVRFDINGQISSNRTVTPGWRNTWEIYPGDYDADGADGLFMFDRTDGAAHLVRFDTAGQIYSSHPVGGTYHLATEFYRGDFDGDGGYDLLTYNRQQSMAGALSRILRFDDIGYIQEEVVVSNTLSPSAALTVGDFTGNGVADLYLHYDNASSAESYMMTFDKSSNVASFKQVVRTTSMNEAAFAGDFDGVPGAELMSVIPPSQCNSAIGNILAFEADGSYDRGWSAYFLPCLP